MEKTLKIILEQKDECLICSSPSDLKDSFSSNSLLWLNGDDENFITLGDLLSYLLKKEKHYYANMIMCSECTNNAVTSYKFMQKCESNEKTMNKLLIGLTGITDMTLAGLTNGDKAAFMQIDTQKGKFNAFCDTQVMKTLSLTLDRFKSILNSVSNDNHNDTKQVEASESDDTETSDSSEFDPSDCEDYSDTEKKFHCGICCKKFHSKSNLNYHIDQVHRPKAFQCTTCEKSFGSEMILKKHLEKHENNQNHKTCHICGKMFTKSPALNDHILSHSMNLQCEKCIRKFTSNKAFLRHQKRDTCNKPPDESKNYNCNECDSKFSSKWSLSKHIDFKHKGIAGFMCEICSAKFQNKSQIDKHVRRMHTNERPSYPCTQCDKIFFTKSYLNTHIRTAHTGEFAAKCYYCDVKFHGSNKRTDHIVKMHRDKTFGCDKCNGIFISMLRFSKHSTQCKGFRSRRRRKANQSNDV